MGKYQNICTGRGCLSVMHAYLVYVTKYRHKVFAGTHVKRMEESMRSLCEDFEIELVGFNGESDHVHLLVNFPPKSPCPSWSTA